jgi:hypothetical protein
MSGNRTTAIYQREYYAKNRERCGRYFKEWRAKNKDKVRAYAKKNLEKRKLINRGGYVAEKTQIISLENKIKELEAENFVLRGLLADRPTDDL